MQIWTGKLNTVAETRIYKLLVIVL